VEHDGRCVGEARLDALDAEDARAQYAVGLQVPSLLGQGLGREVTRLVLAHAFGAVGLHRVGLRVLAVNERAIRCYASYGFRVEGRLREVTRIDGVWHDDLIMGVLAHEFTA
jgi:RimJ/RimL family protein N-acetyltransferase